MPETSPPRASPAGPSADRRPSGVSHVLSAVEFDVVWEALGLGPTPVVLQLALPRPHAHRAAAHRRRRVGGPARARADVAGPTSSSCLRLLAGPSARVELRAWGRSTVRAVAAAGPDGAGVLARRRGDDVVLEPCTSPAVRRRRAPPPGRRRAGPGRRRAHRGPRRRPAPGRPARACGPT